jgi:phenylpropionate dioxygenase-like ring-hydroxylating dioxygenase large terminal subunit
MRDSLDPALGSDLRGMPLPVADYFDAEVFRREQSALFATAPRYLGHTLAVPEPGDYYALPTEGEGRALVHGPGGVTLLSNICRHRQALMLRGRGNTGVSIVCPVHRWTYALSGALRGAPRFHEEPCRHLQTYPTETWNGLVFEPVTGRSVARDLAGLRTWGVAEGFDANAVLDFGGYALDRIHVKTCAYNWKTYAEVFLEDYHVAPFRPGLAGFVSCSEVQWGFGTHHAVQHVRALPSGTRPGSGAYARWQDALRRVSTPPGPGPGALWFSYYPSLMIEWYPLVLIVSSLTPLGPERTLNVIEFYYPQEVAAFERELVEAQQAAYFETGAEDDEIALRLTLGRQALVARGGDDAGPYQRPLEDGMQHFHGWYRGAMAAGAR